VAAFTLIELMIVVAVLAIIVTLAAPSFRDMILMQRLRALNAQVVTDIAWARSEAISRGSFIQFNFGSSSGAGGKSCYIIYARGDALPAPLCDCLAAEGTRCPASAVEVRTVIAPNNESVNVTQFAGGPSYFTFDPRTGGLALPPSDLENSAPEPFVLETFIDSGRKFRATVAISGRTTVCAPSGSTVGGAAC
jgi:type IV fimbrial biogenesis protein FimT